MRNIVDKLNGRHLYYAFLAGSNNILNNQVELNAINVFPVSDKDTGTNLASTVRAVIDNIIIDSSIDKTLENIAEAALIGARGNSGVIFAQFFYSLSSQIKNKAEVTISEFSECIKNAIPHIYNAVNKPVEGTILTVIKDWADFIYNKKNGLKDFSKLLFDSYEKIQTSLKETTSKLSVLSKYGLVDAGAKGFVLFIEGIINLIKNKNINTLLEKVNANKLKIKRHVEQVYNDEIKYRYCTEGMLNNLTIDLKKLREKLEDYGDSIVIAGSQDKCRIHIHTNIPDDLFYDLNNYCTIPFQKVDDMVKQNEIINHKKWNIALVTDSCCDLAEELLDYYQINVVPLSINFGENHYLDKVTIKPSLFYNVLKHSKLFPSTSQINERAFINTYSQLASNYDAIISVHLTDKFSGTYANAVKAAEKIKKELNKDIYVFDSKTLSGALGLVVYKVAKQIEAGQSFESITSGLENLRKKSRIYVSVKTLKYMVRGGRVSKPKGFIANLLGVNPIVSMDQEGNSLLIGKTFSSKASLKKIFKQVTKLHNEQEVENYILLHAHNPKEIEEVKKKMKEITNLKPKSVVDISPVIGMNAGYGTVAISLMLKR